MNITCPHCKTKLNIPDHKIPKDKDSVFKCPKCRDKIQVSASPSNPSGLNQSGLNMAGTGAKKNETMPKKSMGPALSLAQVGEQALVCMEDSPGKIKVVSALEGLGFQVETQTSILEVFKQMTYQFYPLVLVDYSFDQNQGFEAMAIYMNELDTSLRRRICLVLLSDRLPSGDPMSALHSSVNYIIGTDNLDHASQLLSTALTEHQNFYRVYNDSMRAVGKA